MAPESSALTIPKLTKDVDSAIQSHSFADVFKEVRDQLSSEKSNPAQQQQDMGQYRDAINKELTSKGFPSIDLKLDDQGNMHVLDVKGKELDPSTADLAAKATDSGTPKATEASTSKTGDSQWWQSHGAKDTDKGTDISVQKGDTLWKISEHDLEKRWGRKLDPTNMKDMNAAYKHAKELGAAQDPPIGIDANGRAMIKEKQTIHIPKDTAVTDPNKGADTHGKKTEGDKQQPGDKSDADKGKTKVETDNDGNKTTTYPDGVVKVENKDGTGSVTQKDGSKHTWGPKDDDNTDVKVNGDGSSTTTYAKTGTKVTEWDDRTKRTDYTDGSGKVDYPDNDNTEKHWGPTKGDNWTGKDGKDGSRVYTGVNGNVETVYQDNSTRFDNTDGSGSSWVHQADGTYKVHRWGPKSSDNPPDIIATEADRTKEENDRGNA